MQSDILTVIEQLKDISIKFFNKLRFPLDYLQIKKDNSWTTFPRLTGVIRTKANQEITTGLIDILLDTGNETDYCVLGGQYLNEFKERIGDVTLNSKKQNRMVGEPRDLRVSEKTFALKFCDIPFSSKIAFFKPVNENDFNCLNIGIKHISKFLNIIIPPNLYYCLDISNFED